MEPCMFLNYKKKNIAQTMIFDTVQMWFMNVAY